MSDTIKPINQYHKEQLYALLKIKTLECDELREEIDNNEIYKHHRGSEYIKLHEGYIESDGAHVVIYQHCKTKEVWVRPIDEFNSKFTKVGENEKT